MSKGFLFALAGNLCFMGLLASLYRPVWFRVNGRVPSRWKIGGIWLALCALCTLLSVMAGTRFPSEAEAVPHTQTIEADTPSFDVAVPAESVNVEQNAMDEARAIDESAEAVRAAAAQRVAPPSMASRPGASPKPTARPPTPQR